ncbi:hypothetical protein T03_16269 [Trichinella britovi]|uniref:Uncharacterized protein n=1 Tax=Trichinella britovi TaxID=45882 RepID=A0A0V1DA24_TRIBR|nr:hypothetical protein T03_16269 [Trichinella britovi]
MLTLYGLACILTGWKRGLTPSRFSAEVGIGATACPAQNQHQDRSTRQYSEGCTNTQNHP